MCVLIIAEEVFPSLDVLRASEEVNPHGGGIAWIQDNKVRWRKGLTADQINEYRHFTNPPWLIHFRISSISGDDGNPNLCHPFPINQEASIELEGEADQVLGHNGHWFQWNTVLLNSLSPTNVLPEGAWSDTRAMAWLTNFYGEALLRVIDPTQKIAVLSPETLNKDPGERVTRYGNGWIYYPSQRHTYFSNNVWTKLDEKRKKEEEGNKGGEEGVQITLVTS